MSTFVLKAARREPGRARAVRRAGFVPGIVYGGGEGNVAVQIAMSEIIRLFGQHGGRGLLQLEIEGKSETVMIEEVQRHPVRQDVLHLDFLRVRMSEKVQANVPLRLEGEEALARAGAVLQQQLREVEVSCLPADLPQEIVVDVSNLQPGAALTVGQLQAPAGVEILNEPEQVVAVAILPRAAQAAVDQEGAEGAGGAGDEAEGSGDDVAEGDESAADA